MNSDGECPEIICSRECVNKQKNGEVVPQNTFIGFSFEARESLLTPHFRSLTHLRVIDNWILGVFIVYLLCHLTNYALNPNEFRIDIKLIQHGLRNFHIVLILEFFYALWSIGQWALAHIEKNRFSIPIQFILAMVYIIVPIAFRFKYDLSFAMGMFLAIEQIRILMMVYSFWIETVVSGREGKTATFYQFIYFWFSPTLLYRSSYPRSTSRSWVKCMTYFLEFFACVAALLIFGRHIIIDDIWNSENHPIKIASMPMKFFKFFLASICASLLFWFSFFHCWLNAWAEALKFGDRHFYGPWWIITFENKIHRLWNPLVHQWLKCYIYSPNKERIGRKGAYFMTMVISAIAHEYSIGFGSGFLVLWTSFFLLGACIPIFFERKSGKMTNCHSFLNAENILALSLNSMFYMFIGLYIAFESYYRRNCSTTQGQNQITDFIVPKLFNSIEFIRDSKISLVSDNGNPFLSHICY